MSDERNEVRVGDPDEILTLAEAVPVVKLSSSVLYRVAAEGLRGGDTPFRKVRGRWLTTRGDLVSWIRRHPRGLARRCSTDPMPSSRTRGESVNDLLKQVDDLRASA